jgi:hypothetical protein
MNSQSSTQRQILWRLEEFQNVLWKRISTVGNSVVSGTCSPEEDQRLQLLIVNITRWYGREKSPLNRRFKTPWVYYGCSDLRSLSQCHIGISQWSINRQDQNQYGNCLYRILHEKKHSYTLNCAEKKHLREKAEENFANRKSLSPWPNIPMNTPRTKMTRGSNSPSIVRCFALLVDYPLFVRKGQSSNSHW